MLIGYSLIRDNRAALSLAISTSALEILPLLIKAQNDHMIDEQRCHGPPRSLYWKYCNYHYRCTPIEKVINFWGGGIRICRRADLKGKCIPARATV